MSETIPAPEKDAQKSDYADIEAALRRAARKAIRQAREAGLEPVVADPEALAAFEAEED